MAYGKKNKVSAKEKVSRLHMNTTLSINTTIEMMCDFMIEKNIAPRAEVEAYFTVERFEAKQGELAKKWGIA